jgi:methionyl-tRNA synthetase
VLYVTAEVLRAVAITAQPFVPTAAARLLDLLAVPGDSRGFSALSSHSDRLGAGTRLPAPSPIFPRYVEPEEAA